MGCNLVNIYIHLLYKNVSNYIFIHIKRHIWLIDCKFLCAGASSLWEGSWGSDALCSTLHGGNGVYLWPIARGGEEEDKLPQTGFPVHPQTLGCHQQWQVCEKGPSQNLSFSFTHNEWIKQVFSLSVSVKAVYNELHNTLMSISEQEDLRWWKNTHGPGMPTDWPQFQVYIANTFIVANINWNFSVQCLWYFGSSFTISLWVFSPILSSAMRNVQ